MKRQIETKIKTVVPHVEAHEKHDDKGREILDSTPMAMPIGFDRPPTLQEMIARATRNELRMMMNEQNEDGLQEELLDDDDAENGPTSPYELVYDEKTGREVTQEAKAFLDSKRHEFDAYLREQTKKRKAATRANESSGRTAKRKKPVQTDIDDFIEDEE